MSNKTLKEPHVETESAPKSKLKITLIVYIIIVILVFAGLLIRQFINKNIGLLTPTSKIKIELADTAKKRQLGLSGRKSISENDGMLFVFASSSKNNCFWMKDMNFAIDMVWLDDQKKVVTITQNVGPETYPKSFCPDSPAKYGLELKSGNSNTKGITTGVELRF